MTAALVALGSNLGDRSATLDRAVQWLAESPNVRLLAASRPFATQPIGGPTGQSEFLNAAALFETSLDPAAFFAALMQVELALGRRRDGPRWGARPIDLDLLLFGSLVVESPGLTVPHPRMGYRRFVVEPAAEIAPDMRHPTIGWTLAQLRDHLRLAAPYFAIAGAPGAGKTQLASDVPAALGTRLLSDPAAQQTLAVAQATPSSGAAASGPAWEREIEFLELRSAQLAAAVQCGAAASVVISDYWFDQSLCLAAAALPHERVQQFRERWQAAATAVVRPKLLVLMDAPVEWLWQRAERDSARPPWLNCEALAQLREAIVDRAMGPNQGPVLRLDSRQPESAKIELTAAIQATA